MVRDGQVTSSAIHRVGYTVPASEARDLIHEKETIYRELFAPVFTEVAGFKAFSERGVATGFKMGVGTAGDKHNIAFAMSHLKMRVTPHTIVRW